MSSDESEAPGIPKPEISRYAFAFFDVLGFSRWVASVGLEAVLDAYYELIHRVVLRPNEKGSLGTVQTPEGALFVVSRPPSFAYFSDTIFLWCPLAPPLFADFVERCSDMVCEALIMDIPLRGAITLGDAVLDADAQFFLGEPIVEAANLEKGQNWVGLTLGNSAVWAPFLAQLHGTAIIEYEPPVKPAYKEFASPIVVDWPRRWRDKQSTNPIDKLRELNVDPGFATYWDNTIEFAEYSLAKNDWHLRPEEIPEDAILKLVSREDARF